MRARQDEEIARAASRHLDQQSFDRVAARNERRRPRGECRFLLRTMLIQLFHKLVEVRIADQLGHSPVTSCHNSFSAQRGGVEHSGGSACSKPLWSIPMPPIANSLGCPSRWPCIR